MNRKPSKLFSLIFKYILYLARHCETSDVVKLIKYANDLAIVVVDNNDR